MGSSFTRIALPTVACGVLAALALVGCAPEPIAPPQPSKTESAPPPPTPAELRHQAAQEWADQATTRELAGSVIMTSIPTADPTQLQALMKNGAFGGFLLMGANVPGTPEELSAVVTALAEDSALPPLVAIDEEGGLVTRLPWDTLPGADTLRSEPVTATTEAFAGRAALLAQSGVTVNFGIVADVTADPLSFIYDRTLGNTASEAAPRVAAAVAAERGPVASTLKHFPGHGAAPGDSHHGIPTTDMSLQKWQSDAAPPFTAGIDAGAEMLMFGHLSYTAITPTPASLAPEWYKLARTELGFTGVAVTDDLGMLLSSGEPAYADPVANSVAALNAGADLALTVIGVDEAVALSLVDGVTAAAESGALPKDRLKEAAVRVNELRRQLIAEQNPAADQENTASP